MYIWQQTGWPDITWDQKILSKLLGEAYREQGRLLGKMETLGFELQAEAVLHTLTEDVVKSSEIEGEKLDDEQVRSSIARRLGMDIAGLVPADRNVEGVVEMMLDATGKYDEPLTQDRLFGWHAACRSSGLSMRQAAGHGSGISFFRWSPDGRHLLVGRDTDRNQWNQDTHHLDRF